MGSFARGLFLSCMALVTSASNRVKSQRSSSAAAVVDGFVACDGLISACRYADSALARIHQTVIFKGQIIRREAGRCPEGVEI